MISEVRGVVYGPYRSGQENKLKQDVIKARERHDPRLVHFCIETEETEPGFPDVLSILGRTYVFIEFKVSDDQGYLTFTRAQPLFYRRNNTARIVIMAWDVPNRRLLTIDADHVVKHVFETALYRFPCPKGPVPPHGEDLQLLTPEARASLGAQP